MPYGQFTRIVGHDVPLAIVATCPSAQPCVACILAPEARVPVPSAWVNVYRLAYEQAKAALEPSRFQVMLEPRWN